MTDHTIYSLATDLVRLEEKMNTKQAEYRTEIAQLAQKLAESDARAASERTAHTRWLIGAIAIATLIIIGSLNILLQ